MSTLLALPIHTCHENSVSEHGNRILDRTTTGLDTCSNALVLSLFQSSQPSHSRLIAKNEIIKETQALLENLAKNTIAPEISYSIRCIERNEVLTLCQWKHVEFGYRAHWDYLLSLYDCDCQGFLVACDANGDIMGVILGVNLNEELAFGGLYVVKSIYECQDLGLELWKQRLLHIGDRNLGINSVRSRVAPNQKKGMKLSFRPRYFGNPSQESMLKYVNKITTSNKDVKFICPDEDNLLSSKELEALIEYDATISLAKRELFLRQTLSHYEHTITVIAISKTPLINGPIVFGYGMLRPTYIGYTLGPIYAENMDIAEGILKELIKIYRIIRVDATLLEITVIDDEGEVSTCSYQKTLDHERRNVMNHFLNDLELYHECYLYRMYSKDDIKLPLHKAYAITSSEAFLL